MIEFTVSAIHQHVGWFDLGSIIPLRRAGLHTLLCTCAPLTAASIGRIRSGDYEGRSCDLASSSIEALLRVVVSLLHQAEGPESILVLHNYRGQVPNNIYNSYVEPRYPLHVKNGNGGPSLHWAQFGTAWLLAKRPWIK